MGQWFKYRRFAKKHKHRQTWAGKHKWRMSSDEALVTRRTNFTIHSLPLQLFFHQPSQAVAAAAASRNRSCTALTTFIDRSPNFSSSATVMSRKNLHRSSCKLYCSISAYSGSTLCLAGATVAVDAAARLSPARRCTRWCRHHSLDPSSLAVLHSWWAVGLPVVRNLTGVEGG